MLYCFWGVAQPVTKTKHSRQHHPKTSRSERMDFSLTRPKSGSSAEKKIDAFGRQRTKTWGMMGTKLHMFMFPPKKVQNSLKWRRLKLKQTDLSFWSCVLLVLIFRSALVGVVERLNFTTRTSYTSIFKKCPPSMKKSRWYTKYIYIYLSGYFLLIYT